MNKGHIDKIITFNDEFFGSDKSRNYIKHDFRRVIEGFVQREVIIRVANECSKARHSKKEITNKEGKVISVTYGDYDEDNAGFLYPLIKNQELGLMIDLRLLFTKKEKGSGGKFINDLISLKAEDFINYFKFSKVDGATLLPPLLNHEYFASRKSKSGESVSDLIDIHSSKIEYTVNDLIEKAKKFNDKNYSKLLIEEYEALKFHKDRQPEKYEIRENKEGIGGYEFTTTTRLDKSNIDSRKITEALNEFSEVVGIYQLLIGKSVFFGSSWPLDTYMERTFALFRKEVPDVTRKEAVSNIVKYLQASLNLMAWRVSDTESNQ